jgi:GNAT superfamily N-acetyltransferase
LGALASGLSVAAALEVAPAAESDLEVASAILSEAAGWLIERGDPLWRLDDLVPDRLRAEVEAGTLHLGRLDGEPVATLVLQWQDRLFWPDLPSGKSAFIHRLAVRRRVAGSGVAAAMIAWAEEQALAAGRGFLRLDCSAEHPGLGRYYEAAGFERHSEATVAGYSVLRYQKRLR